MDVNKARIQALTRYDPEVENVRIEKLNLSARSRNALQRAGYSTVGEIMSNWRSLKRGPRDGIGASVVKEVHATVFALLCDVDGVKKLQMDMGQFPVYDPDEEKGEGPEDATPETQMHEDIIPQEEVISK